MQEIIGWLSNNALELSGFAAALIYLYFSINQNQLLWPWGIATSAVYVYIFFDSKIYGYAALNLYYVFISLYGWYHWRSANQTNQAGSLKPKPGRIKNWGLVIGISLLFWVAIYFILSRFTDSQIPAGDSFTTAFSIMATWLLARKILENWIFWIVIDAVACGIYFQQELYLTSILYLVYTIMAIIGYLEWKKSLS
jgi:nicotinamide mononucleotide transporter